MEVTFEEEKHRYKIDNEYARLSVTELLKKHGLAPSYENVDEAVLKEAQERGVLIHRDLELIFSEAGYEPLTKEAQNFDKWVYEHISSATAEMVLGMVYNTAPMLCGTADIVGFLKDGKPFIGDHKTTSTINYEAVSWQLSLYDYMLRWITKNGGQLNGKTIKWKGAKKLYCFHYKKNGDLKAVEIDRIPDGEIERLLDAEFNNEKYQRPMLVIDPTFLRRYEQAELMLKNAEETAKIAKETANEMRQQLLELFEEQGIRSWESPSGKVRVSYVSPTKRQGMDNERLRREFPQAYNSCIKWTPVRSSIRITFRKESEDSD